MCPQFLADELRVLLWEPELGTREFDDLASARKCIGKSFRLVPALEGPRHEFKIALGLRAVSLSREDRFMKCSGPEARLRVA
jgi:hypothetical protein